MQLNGMPLNGMRLDVIDKGCLDRLMHLGSPFDH